MKVKEWLGLLGVAIAAFVFNCSEFMPVGLLTDIGATFATSESQTGLLVSVYAWAVMLLSVPLMIVGTRINMRPLFLIVLIVFFIGQVLTAFSINYWMMMASRLVVACAHCIFWAIGVPLSVRLVDEKHGALALSVFEVGAAAALVVGMPIGRAIGLIVGWRMTFGIVAIMSFILIVYVFFTLPSVNSEEAFKINQIPSLFKNKGLVSIFIQTALYAWSYYVGYSYIEPFLLQAANMDKGIVTLALAIFGLAGVSACLMSSKIYPKFRFNVIKLATIGVPLALTLMALLYNLQNPTIILLICIIWGISGSTVAVVYQGEIINVADDEEQTVAMAFFSGIFNFGIGFGAFLGGKVVDDFGISSVCAAGALIGFFSIAFCLLILLKQLKKFKVKL